MAVYRFQRFLILQGTMRPRDTATVALVQTKAGRGHAHISTVACPRLSSLSAEWQLPGINRLTPPPCRLRSRAVAMSTEPSTDPQPLHRFVAPPQAEYVFGNIGGEKEAQQQQQRDRNPDFFAAGPVDHEEQVRRN